mmetsp:Transcript_19180/g.52682  ORF Transcript_19180/g.52682 Transcript_19180/m.52682 type:complete len:209 (+) Transcript_19180:671-1297(+)
MFEFVGRVPELFANGFRQIMRRGDARNGVVKADAPLLLLSSCRAVVGTVLRVGTRHGTVAAAAEVLFLLWRINLHLELREHFFVGRVLFLNHRNAHQAPAAATTRAAHATATSLAGFFLIILILIIIVVVFAGRQQGGRRNGGGIYRCIVFSSPSSVFWLLLVQVGRCVFLGRIIVITITIVVVVKSFQGNQILCLGCFGTAFLALLE